MGLNSFDKLIKPYKDGGTEKGPVDVTIGNICSKLMVSYRIPPDVVGAALYKVMDAVANKGLEFKGNDKYGSKGAELFSCIKAQCVDLTENKSVREVVNKIFKQTSCLRDCRYRTKVLEKKSRWVRIKNFWTEPRENYLYCLLWVSLFTIITELIWRYVTA